MKCKRPNCTSPNGRKAFHGFCAPHYESFRREREAKGGRKVGRIPSGPAVEHVNRLRESGLGYRKIAELAGLTPPSVQKLYRRKSVFRDTAEKLLSVSVPAVEHELALLGTRVPVLGYSRRLQALIALGWPGKVLAERLGVSESSFSQWLLGRKKYLTADHAKSVDQLYQELHLVSPGDSTASRRAKNRAIKNGWALPFAWEDIDNPSSVPDYGAKGEFSDTYKDFRAQGRDDHYIAKFFGIKTDSLKQRVRREVA